MCDEKKILRKIIKVSMHSRLACKGRYKILQVDYSSPIQWPVGYCVKVLSEVEARASVLSTS